MERLHLAGIWVPASSLGVECCPEVCPTDKDNWVSPHLSLLSETKLTGQHPRVFSFAWTYQNWLKAHPQEKKKISNMEKQSETGKNTHIGLCTSPICFKNYRAECVAICPLDSGAVWGGGGKRIILRGEQSPGISMVSGLEMLPPGCFLPCSSWPTVLKVSFLFYRAITLLHSISRMFQHWSQCRHSGFVGGRQPACCLSQRLVNSISKESRIPGSW